MSRQRLIHISDLHLSQTWAYTYPNWRTILRYVNETRPDLVVMTGDSILNEPEDTDDLHFAWKEMAQIEVPLAVLPGDHDIGGGPPAPRPRPEVPWLERYPVTEARRERFIESFGQDHWSRPFGDWYLIGLNDLIFGSGFDAEATQWDFLQAQLHEAAGRPTALFMHKPPCIYSFAETKAVTKAIPVEARQRLMALLPGNNIRLICTGHLHVFRTFQTLGVTVVVAPTIMRGEDDYPSHNGLAVNGMVEYVFEGEGVEFRLVEPPGISRPSLPAGPRHLWPERPANRF